MTMLTPDEKKYIEDNRKYIRKLEKQVIDILEKLPKEERIPFDKLNTSEINVIKQLWILSPDFSVAQIVSMGYTRNMAQRMCRKFDDIGISTTTGKGKHRFKRHRE